MPPGEILVSPTNPYGSLSSDLQPTSTTSNASESLLGTHSSLFNDLDMSSYSNFFTVFTGQEGLLKEDLLRGEGGQGMAGVANGVPANFNFDGGFDFQLGFDPNVPLPGLSNEDLLGPAPELPHSQFISDGQYDFGDGSGFVNNLLGLQQDQAGPSSTSNEAHVLDRSAFVPQSQLLPTPPETESSPKSAGSTDARQNQTSPVDVRPRSYMPPPGASNTSMRRAAGTWRPPANMLNDEE